MKVLVLSIIVFTALASASSNLSQYKEQFEAFKTKYSKEYESKTEELKRLRIFAENVQNIKEHNQKNLGWQEKVTKFSDLTKEEFRQKHLNGYQKMAKTQAPKFSGTNRNIDLTQLPTSKDWRDDGIITPVKDQKSCGSCWAFTTVELIESYTALATGKTPPILSAQQMTSCALNPYQCGGSGGCAGNVVELGLNYAQLYPITLDIEYPYASGIGITGACDWNPDLYSSQAQVMGYELLERNNYARIMDHLANVGPLAVSVDASSWGNFAFGVFSGCNFTENININHAVQLVGYGVDTTNPLNQKPYWLVRNSWDSDWGDEGYIKLERNDVPKCGQDITPLNGTACLNDGVSVQNVCGQCGILFDTVYPIGAFVP